MKEFVSKEQIDDEIKRLKKLRESLPSIKFKEIYFGNELHVIMIRNYTNKPVNLNIITGIINNAMYSIENGVEITKTDKNVFIKIRGERKIIAVKYKGEPIIKDLKGGEYIEFEGQIDKLKPLLIEIN